MIILTTIGVWGGGGGGGGGAAALPNSGRTVGEFRAKQEEKISWQNVDKIIYIFAARKGRKQYFF